MKAGAPRRKDVRRYPKTGTIIREDRGERPEKIMAVVLAQPHRRGETSQLAGFAYGRLHLGGSITDIQFRAAEIYQRRASRYMRTITGSIPAGNNPLANLIKRDLEEQREQERAPDFSIRSEPITDEERIACIRSDYGEIQDALAEGGLHFDGNSILTRVCILDREPVNEHELGAFRCALNVIARRLRL